MHHRNVCTRRCDICLRNIVPSIEPAIICTLWEGYFVTLRDISHECWEKSSDTSSTCWNSTRIIESFMCLWTDKLNESFDTLSLRKLDNNTSTSADIILERTHIQHRHTRQVPLVFLPGLYDTGSILFVGDRYGIPLKHSIKIRLQILLYTSLLSGSKNELLRLVLGEILQISW